MSLDEIEAFTQVVRSGSFTAAAKVLVAPKSTVSRKVADLERRMGVALLLRTTRKLSLTNAGRSYFEACSRALAELDEAEAVATQSQQHPKGLLRVTAPIELGSALLPALTRSFITVHEQVQVEAILTDRIVDLLSEGVDLAIRTGTLGDSAGLIAKKLAQEEFQVFASPDYVRKRGSPQHPKELQSHSCLRFPADNLLHRWNFVRGRSQYSVNVNGRLIANSFGMIERWAVEGAGIALLPDFLCEASIASGRLVRILPEWISAREPIYAVYPASRFLPPKVRAFVDHLSGHFAAGGFGLGRGRRST